MHCGPWYSTRVPERPQIRYNRRRGAERRSREARAYPRSPMKTALAPAGAGWLPLLRDDLVQIVGLRAELAWCSRSGRPSCSPAPSRICRVGESRRRSWRSARCTCSRGRASEAGLQSRQSGTPAMSSSSPISRQSCASSLLRAPRQRRSSRSSVRGTSMRSVVSVR